MMFRHLAPRRVFTLLILLLALAIGSPVQQAEARSTRRSAVKEGKRSKRVARKRAKARRARKRAKVRRARRRAKVRRARRRAKVRRARKRRKRRRRGRFRGHGVKKEALRTEPLPKPSGDLWVFAPNWREEIKVNIFDEGGRLDDTALAQIDHTFRCRRTGEERAIDPRLAKVLSIISDHFGGKRIELVSAFRFQRNEGSRHYHASAVDIRIDGVSSRALYKFAQSLDSGGMGIGYYPRSGFVHIDYRAPGDPSYRWIDTSGPGTGAKGGAPSRKWKRRQPGS